MADSNLNTSIAAIAQDLVNKASTASLVELKQIARAAKKIGHSENGPLEIAINTRLNSLMTNATADDLETMAEIIDDMTNPIVPSTQVDLSSITQDIIPATGTVDLGHSTNPFGSIYAANLYVTNGEVSTLPTTDNDIANKKYVDDSITNISFTDLVPTLDSTYDLGSSTLKWDNLYVNTVTGLTTPVNPTDAATKDYVDNLTSGATTSVTSVNGYLGNVVLTTDEIDEGIYNLYFTDQRVQDYLSANSYVTQSYVDSAVAAGGGGGGGGASVSTTPNPPTGAADGDLWYNSEDGSIYVYYADVDSSQWVQIVNPFGVPGLFELDGIVDGTNGQVLYTDGAGNVSFNDLPFIPLSLVELSDFPSTESANQVLTTDGTNNYTFQHVKSENVIWKVYGNIGELPAAADNHGMFAHVHDTGKAYYAHAGNWIELANVNELFSESYNDLTDKPFIPSALTDLGISDGSAEQILQTDGNGNFTFVDRVGAKVVVNEVAPSGIVNLQGDLWYNTEDGSIYVYYVDADSGQWVQVVNPFGVPGLEELDDVQLGPVLDWQFLQYNPTLGQWTNSYPSIKHLGDVSTSGTPVEDDLLRWNNVTAQWEFEKLEYNDLTVKPTLEEIDNVLSATPNDGDFLKYNNVNSQWEFSKLVIDDFSTRPDLQDLNDVDSVNTPTNGQTVHWVSAQNEWQFRDIPASILDLQISDGTIGQLLTTDGNGTFQFTDRIGASVTISATAPNAGIDGGPLLPGDIWYSSDEGSFYVYYQDVDSSQWVQVINPLPEVFPDRIIDLTDYDPGTGILDGQVLKYNSSTAKFQPSTVANIDWTETATPTQYNISRGERLFVDCSLNPVTVVLPLTPQFGDEVRIIDVTGNASTNNITINRNGQPIERAQDDLIIDVDRAAFGLVYYNTTEGWVFMEK